MLGMDNRSHHPMIPSNPMDRYLQERPYGQPQHQQQQQTLQHSHSYAHVQQQPTSPPLERTHPPIPASPHHSPQSASPTGSSPTNSFNLGGSSHLPSKRRRVPTEERKRTAMSCDRCKSRKIKCVDPSPGPCMYCASSGHECKITMARKQRPFYYASEEQFRWLQIIASRISPGTDLNDIGQLKEMAAGLEVIKREPGVESPEDDDRPGRSESTPINIEQEEGMEGVVDGIGTLMLDPLGREKYIGESASVSFHRKVREYVQSQRPGATLGTRSIPDRFPEPHDPSEPADLVNADEPALDSTTTVETPNNILVPSPRSVFSTGTTAPSALRSRLPPRHLADPLVDRFFKQVHSIFWVFPPDQFLRRLEKTYSFYDLDVYGETERTCTEGDRREVEVPSWMCCVFTVLALGCSTDDNGHDILKPSDFFAAAKCLSRVVVEDESIQSIQALLLMSLYTANTDLRSLGWIYLGDAIRLAQLLGLHRNDAALQYSDIVERETRRRLWWTLYEFERMANGCPAAIHDADSDTALPSESLLSPGDYTPMGYLGSSVALAQISGHIFQGMYSVPPQRVPNVQGNRLSRRTIADLYGELVRWRHDVPPHLRINSNSLDQSMNPSVMRALAFLDLRFQYAIISVTRPLLFRLVSAVRDGSFDTLSLESRTFITTYSDACAQSARSSLSTLKFMHQNQLLNNVLWLDAFYILSTAMVLLLAFLRATSASEARRVHECISILRELQPRGTGRIVLDSLSDLATFLGLDEVPSASSPHDTHHGGNPGDLQLYELFSSTATTPGTAAGGINSPEISVNGWGGVGVGGYHNVGGMAGDGGGQGGGGPNEFAWMDQIVRMAYAEFGPT